MSNSIKIKMKKEEFKIKVAFKFKDGLEHVVDYGENPTGGGDFLGYITSVKGTKTPIEIVHDDEAITKRTWDELSSIEFILS
ncbi:hypothetical protein [Oceanobacillus neutriphilus]|uniref:Uncharacterized protein n=1 Tax=Oceanobacillus neutriphilus TaxID=531815 RepID=A0ABQ2NZ72_9BACI|nr:hypothetical protein [Oceanobacillus neutriphilus]GGP14224.1 hypothetical protein GCM10011346_37510 [Oceanobacillus neutriphilus]